MNECREGLLASKVQTSSRGDSMLSWLTAGQLAASIINFAPPALAQGIYILFLFLTASLSRLVVFCFCLFLIFYCYSSFLNFINYFLLE